MTLDPSGAHRFDFEDLFVLDLANNHQGSVDHGRRIIARCAEAAERHGVRAAIKFQFRDLPDFVHVDEQREPRNKHVPRFLSTLMPWEGFAELLAAVRSHGMLAMCTPFDESSVDRIVTMGFDLIKVASASATDWPLLERVAGSGLPVVASTGGLTRSGADDLVSFLQHRGCDFALMHCVSIYPAPDETCQLSNIGEFRTRYPGVTVGWSTHEDPSDTVPVAVAYAQGARMFERHVGLPTEEVTLNAYSSAPDQLDAWLAAWHKARTLVGDPSTGSSPRRSASRSTNCGAACSRAATSRRARCSPRTTSTSRSRCATGQLPSGRWRDGLRLDAAVSADGPLPGEAVTEPDRTHERILKDAIHDVKAMLAHAHVPLSVDFQTEYSHHYGIEHFRQVGTVLMTIINRAYAKKILVQLPGQRHPAHFHKLKEESFHVLWGELDVVLDGRSRRSAPRRRADRAPGRVARVLERTGCVFEELSTTALTDDSFYRDPEIVRLTSAQRKTVVDHWGRFQITEQLLRAELPDRSVIGGLRVLAVVPARGGSKGLPRKNLLPVGGVPLVARVGDVVMACPSIDRAVVSTDDEEIAAAAVGCRARRAVPPTGGALR
jgi:sialic acid synthase SpsE